MDVYSYSGSFFFFPEEKKRKENLVCCSWQTEKLIPSLLTFDSLI
jgi:hypothetical protein